MTLPEPYTAPWRRPQKTVEEALDEQLRAFENVKTFSKQERRKVVSTPELRDDGLTLWGEGCTGDDIASSFSGAQLSEVTDIALGEAELSLEACRSVAAWAEHCCLDEVETVDLAYATLPPDGLTAILSALSARRGRSALESLKLDGCTRPTQETLDAASSALQNLKHLEEVSLSSLWLDDDDLTILCQGCINSKAVSALTLDDNRIGPEGAARLVQMMRGCFTLCTLELNHNRLVDAGAAAVLNGLQYAPHVTNVGLGSNGIHSLKEVTPDALAESNLRSLSLRDNHLGLQGTVDLTHCLSGTRHLTALYCPGNSIGADGICVLLAALCNMDSSLRCLDVSSNNISSLQACDDVAQYLADPGAQLLKLDLSFNPIGDEGLHVMDRAFPSTTSLRFLVLQNCGIKETKSYNVELQGSDTQAVQAVLQVDIDEGQAESDESDDTDSCEDDDDTDGEDS